jgi:type IV secretory pathway VirB3-like protein
MVYITYIIYGYVYIYMVNDTIMVMYIFIILKIPCHLVIYGYVHIIYICMYVWFNEDNNGILMGQ